MKLFFRDRMDEPKRRGMQRLPPDQFRAGTAVEQIACYRMSDVGHVDPDLVGPAGLKTQAHKSIALRARGSFGITRSRGPCEASKPLQYPVPGPGAVF